MASKRFGLALAALTLLAGCSNKAREQATADSLAQVEIQARRDSLRKVKATRDSLAVVTYAQEIDGIQIGLLNIIKRGGFLPVCVIANWSK